MQNTRFVTLAVVTPNLPQFCVAQGRLICTDALEHVGQLLYRPRDLRAALNDRRKKQKTRAKLTSPKASLFHFGAFARRWAELVFGVARRSQRPAWGAQLLSPVSSQGD